MNILLLNPPPSGDLELPTKPFPLGTLVISSILKRNGNSVHLLSPTDFSDLSSHVSMQKYDIIGIVSFSRQRYSAFQSAKICKELNGNAHIIVGGPHVLELEEMILNNYKFVDAVISGEAEIATLNYIESLKNNIVYYHQNIFTRNFSKGRKIKYLEITNKNLTEAQLNKLPFPDYYDNYFIEYAQYSRGNMYVGSETMGAIHLSRGCDNKCIFCANRAMFGKHKSFSFDYAIKHLELIRKNFGVTSFDFVDDNFAGNLENSKKFCNEIIIRNINIVWRTSCRIDCLDEELITLMAISGCKMITFGLESANTSTLKYIKKNININHSLRVLDLCKKHNIEIRLTLTFGYSKNEYSILKDTINYLNKVKPDVIAIYLLKLYPGTELYKQAKRERFINDDFWFEDETSIPYYSKYITFDDFNKIKLDLLASINAKIIGSHKSMRDDSEFRLLWN